MTCIICHGAKKSTTTPQGDCWYCRGAGFVPTDDYVRRHHEHTAKRAATDAALRQTYGKSPETELEAVKS